MPDADAEIDIICATYNRSALLRGAIESVLAQTFPRWRLLIVSDASTDDTPEVVAEYDDLRITFLECTPKRRPGGPRNVGLKVSSAPLVAYLDDDDRWRPDHLELVVQRLRAGARWVVAGSTYVDDTGTPKAPARLFGSAWHPELQLVSSMFEPSRVAHTRELLDRVGLWSEGQGINRDDWELWLRFTDHGERVAFSPEATVRIRATGSTMRHTPAYAPDWHHVELGRVPDEATARAVLAAIAEPVVREQLREGYRTGVLGWLRDMWASGQLVLPPGATGGDLVAEWEELGARGARSGWVPLADELRCIRAGDAHVIAYPLACLDQEHGRRIEELVRRRDSDRLRLVRDVVARCARNSGD